MGVAKKTDIRTNTRCVSRIRANYVLPSENTPNPNAPAPTAVMFDFITPDVFVWRTEGPIAVTLSKGVSTL